MNNLERTKFVITYLEQESKQLSHKQVLMEREILKTKRKSDREAHVTWNLIEQELNKIGSLA